MLPCVTGSWHWTLVQGTQRQEGPKRSDRFSVRVQRCQSQVKAYHVTAGQGQGSWVLGVDLG